MSLRVPALLLAVSTLTLGHAAATGLASVGLRELLRTRIEQTGIPPVITVGEELIHASTVLPLFYERRGYQPAWNTDEGPLSHGESLVKALSRADLESLNPNDYHRSRIEGVLGEIQKNRAQGKAINPRRLVDLELLLTDAFLIYASHLLAGKVNPETIDPEWHARRRERDIAVVLQDALEQDQIQKALEDLLPQHEGYSRLKQALLRYREIAAHGDWPQVPPGLILRKGDRGERVIALRRRLIRSGDLAAHFAEAGDEFDAGLEKAVLRFQERHGLEVDGLVGPATLSALNVSVQDRLRQITLNLERWRWLPQDLGKCHIIANIASFWLEVVDGEALPLAMRLVVGKPYRRTPVFSDMVSYLVLSPYWHVPPSIASKDILPLVRQDPEYLTRNSIKVFRGWGADTKEVDPKTIDWQKVSAAGFPFRFRQDPGPSNPLGTVKFMFPNKFNVYLHGTSSQGYFQKATRAFSSGCIRLERPIELAEYLLRADPRWTRETIVATAEKGLEHTVHLSPAVPVHLLYWTAWVDKDGIVHFQSDVYGRDAALDSALRESPPSPGG